MKFILFFYVMDLFMLMILIFPSYYHKFHPLALSLLLLIYSVVLIIKMNYMNMSYWYSYVLFLLMVGGVMILILYLTGISNNELFNLNMNYYYMFFLKLVFIYFLMYFMLKKNNLTNLINFNMMNDLNLNILIFFKDYYFIKNLFLNFCMSIYLLVYMFMLMVVSVLICMKNLSPLRQMKF
nr:NADH dehydrogenase subunit 6 [Meteorus sp. 1 XHS-2023a]